LDLANDLTSIALAEEFWREGKPVGAICHGPAALVNVKDPSGKHIVSGRRVTSFSNTEEEQVKMTHQIPFSIETKLKEVVMSFQSRLIPSLVANMKRIPNHGVHAFV